MRGVLESCWDLSSSGSLLQPLQGHSSRQIRLHRLNRTRSGLHCGPDISARQQAAPQGRSRARSSAAAASAELSSPVLPKHAGVSDQQTYYLQVLLNLGHLYATAQGARRDSSSFSGAQAFLPQPPRLLTPEEERVLGTIIQQYRKLQQLEAQHLHLAAADAGNTNSSVLPSAQVESPAVAGPAAAPTAAADGSSSSTGSSSSASSPAVTVELPRRRGRPSKCKAEASTSSSPPKKRGRPRTRNIDTTSTTSSSSSSAGPDKRHRWPPPLTPSDLAELSKLPQAWRVLLPHLAAQAHQLLVGFNIGLVMFMLRRAWRTQGVPEGDLVSSGLAGLRLAASRFDPSKGTRFSTTATTWIGQHISRSSVAESGKVVRRPQHHLQMVYYVYSRYGMEGVVDIANKPEAAKEVAGHFNTTPSAVVEAIHDSYHQSQAISLEAFAPQQRAGDVSNTAWGDLLTTQDLDEGETQLGPGGQGPTMSGGLGTLMSAAGQMPAWAQAGVRGLHRQDNGGPVAAGSSSSSTRQRFRGAHQSHALQGSQQQLSQVNSSSSRQADAADGTQHQQLLQEAAASGSPHPAVPSALQMQQAATRLVHLASASSTPQPDSITGNMLASMEDTEGQMQQDMQELMHVLTPVERSVISLLYGLESDHVAGLGVELPPLALGSVSSSGTDSSSGRVSQGSTAVTYGSTQGRNPKVISSARFSRGTMTLKQVAETLHISSHQLVANIKNMALGKLAKATRAAAVASSAAGGDDDDDDDAAMPHTQTYVTGSTMQLIERLRQYVAEYGQLPPIRQDLVYQGKRLGTWMQRLRTRYRQGKVSPVVVEALEEAVPIWTWEAEPTAAAGGRRRQRRSAVSRI